MASFHWSNLLEKYWVGEALDKFNKPWEDNVITAISPWLVANGRARFAVIKKKLSFAKKKKKTLSLTRKLVQE